MTRLTDARAGCLGMAWSCLLTLLVVAGVSCLAQTSSKARLNAPNTDVRAADVEAAVGLICKPSDITRSKSGTVSGCRVCPEGTDFHQFTVFPSGWELQSATSGHFTSANDDNLLLSGSGCDSHANNFGGSFVFTFKDGKAKLIRYDNGLLTDQCHKFDFADGRNFLVCRGGFTGQGENDEDVSTASFAASGEEAVDYLISTNDTTGTCDEH